MTTSHKRTGLIAALLAAAAIALFGAVTAGATETVYWGFDYMNGTPNPPAGTCAGHGGAWACPGFNYWDYTRIERSDGGATYYGFEKCPSGQTTGCTAYAHLVYGGGTFTEIWSYWSGMTHYNRAGCWRYYGETYIQCRVLIF